jgi:hypothetical protein
MTPNPATRARVFALLALLLGSAAQAESPRFEVAPFVGGRIGGGLDVKDETTGDEQSVDFNDGASFGVDLGLYAHDFGYYELLYSTQDTSLDARDPALDGVDLRIDYLQFGGTALFPQDSSFFVPWLSFTIGATFLEPKQGNYDSETKFSGSLGGGFRFPVNEHFNVVLGLRGYLTLINSDTDLFCVSDAEQARCLIRSSGSTFFQAEGQLGFSFVF